MHATEAKKTQLRMHEPDFDPSEHLKNAAAGAKAEAATTESYCDATKPLATSDFGLAPSAKRLRRQRRKD
jgi:hypothetical protein